jgi:catechol 2,3-dioxygenase-like lactoylglutathione lyase family enzyme
MITGIHHTSYTVSDMERSLTFYCEGLGFSLVNDRRVAGAFPSTITGFEAAALRVVHLRGYGQGLELIEYGSPKGEPVAPRTCDVGSSQTTIIVDDIDDDCERLKLCGARFLSEPLAVEGGPNAGNRAVYFLDPDGIPMELSQPVRGTSG